MRRSLSVLICVLFVTSNLSCSVNILKTFANTQTNEALYEDAQALINAGDYNGALADIALMTDAYPAMPKVLELKASAYGGLCELNFLDFANKLSQIGSTLLFPFLLQQ